jgi:choline transport protein
MINSDIWSRQMFAFARDGGLPGGPWLAHVSPTWNLPFNSIFVTFITSSLLSLITIFSTSAFTSILSLATNAFLTSYMVSIGCLIWRRWTNSPLPPSNFNLGKWGLPVYIAAESFLVSAFVLCFFPTRPNPGAEAMNYNIAIYGAVVIFSIIYFAFRGRYQYGGPVEYIRRLE